MLVRLHQHYLSHPVGVFLQVADHLPCLGLPHPYLSFIAPRHEELPAPAQLDADHPIPVAILDLPDLLGIGLVGEQANLGVCPAGKEDIVGVVETERRDSLLEVDGVQHLVVIQVPHSNRPIQTGRGKAVTYTLRVGDVLHRVGMALVQKMATTAAIVHLIHVALSCHGHYTLSISTLFQAGQSTHQFQSGLFFAFVTIYPVVDQVSIATAHHEGVFR